MCPHSRAPPANSKTWLHGQITHISPFCVWERRQHVTEAAVCHPVHYENWFGRRPWPRWEPSVTWCWLTHHDVPRHPLLLTVGALVKPGSLPHSLQLPRYHLALFWQRVEERGMWKRRNNHLQAVCWNNSPIAWYCSHFFSLYIVAKILCSSKISCGIKDVKVSEISTLGELLCS